MARGFNENEKQVIKNALIDEGKILFETFGFKKTSIIDITQKVGIAPGTFYTFFPSKEALYFVILEKEELMIREKFTHIHLNKNQQPKVVMKHLLQEMVRMFETNALIREMYIGHHMQQLISRLPSELLEAHIAQDTNALSFLIQHWEKEGIFLTESPDKFGGILRALFMMTFHQKEIGVDVYTETIDTYIDLIVDGLIEGKK